MGAQGHIGEFFLKKHREIKVYRMRIIAPTKIS